MEAATQQRSFPTEISTRGVSASMEGSVMVTLSPKSDPRRWCGVVWCGVVWCGVVWCGVVWCGMV